MKPPKAVLFDLCDTLYLFEPERLPRVAIDGRQIPSTSGIVHEALGLNPTTPFEAFYGALVEVGQEIARQRDSTHEEIPSEEKFRRVLGRLGLGSPTERIINQAVGAHMRALSESLRLPGPHLELIGAIKRRYRTGIITNFDHAQTVHALLDREGIGSFFDPVIISADVGWRKPKREIFEKALDILGMPPGDAVFVGNDLGQDVAGARAAGISPIWFNRDNRPLDPALPSPDCTLARLEELLDLF